MSKASPAALPLIVIFGMSGSGCAYLDLVKSNEGPHDKPVTCESKDGIRSAVVSYPLYGGVQYEFRNNGQAFASNKSPFLREKGSYLKAAKEYCATGAMPGTHP